MKTYIHAEELNETEREKLAKLIQLRKVLERDRFEGLNRKIQLKPLKVEKYVNSKGQEVEKVVEALFILKWGGELTHAGVK